MVKGQKVRKFMVVSTNENPIRGHKLENLEKTYVANRLS